MQQQIISTLTKLGLTQNDSTVYLTLLELGKSKAGDIIKKSKLHSSRVHESLNKLINLGLITHTIQANKKIYNSETPEKLLEIAKELEKETTQLLPKLIETFNQKQEETSAKIYEGYKGLKTLFDYALNELKKGEEHLVFSAVQEPEHFVNYFHHWNKKRIQKGIKMRIAFNEEAKKQILTTTKNKLVKLKLVPKEFSTPAVINIFADNVAIVLWTNTPIAFLIKNKETANSFRRYFELMWNS